MIILDTNVISEFMRPSPSEHVVQWLDGIPSTDAWTTSIVFAEIAAGVALLPHGARQRRLAEAYDSMLALFAGQVLNFDSSAATEYGRVVARRAGLGRPISIADAQIAAVGITSGAVIATRNTADFIGTGADVINPWES